MAGKTIPLRLYAQILIFSALVALGVMILMPIQRAIQGGMLGVRDDLITRLERQIGRKIRYSSISPSFFGSFDVRNVRIMGNDDHPVLTMSRFSVAYSLLDLLRGKVQAIHTVRIDTPFVDLNTTRDQDLIAMLKNLSNPNNGGGGGSQADVAALFPDKLMVRIRNGKCVVLDGRDQFGFDALNLNVEIIGNRMILDGRWDIGVTIDTIIGDPVHLYAITRVSGSCRTDLEEGEAVLSISAITGDAISSNPIALGFSLEDNVLRVGKMPDNLPFDCALTYAIDGGAIDAHFECANFRLRELFTFSGGLEGASRLLDIAGSGTASFERGNDGSLGYAVDLSGTALDAGFPRSATMMTSFEIRAAGDEQYANIDTLRLSIPAAGESAQAFFYGDVRFSGGIGLNPMAPDGVLSLGNFSRSGKNVLNADIVIDTRDRDRGRTPGKEIVISCDTMHLGQDRTSALYALLQPAGDTVGFNVTIANAGTLQLQGSVHSPTRRVEANLNLDSFSAGALADMALPFVKTTSIPAPLIGLLDGTVITTEIKLATDFTAITYNAYRFALSNKAGKGFTVIASLSGTERLFELNGSRLNWGEDTLLVSGKADFADAADIQFSINTIYRDLNYYVDGEILDGKSINIQGSYGLNINLRATGGGYSGSMRAMGFPAPFLGHPAYCSFAAQLTYHSTTAWSMNLDQFEITNIASPAGLAQLRISGSADQSGVDLPLFYYRDPLGPLNGRAGVTWNEDYSVVNGTIFMVDGAENYHITAAAAEGRYYFAFAGSSMRLDRAFRGIKATANGDVRVSWDSSAFFRAEANLHSITGKLYNQDFGATASAVMERGDFSARGTFSFAELQGEIPYFHINGKEGMVQTMASLQGLAGDKPIEGGLMLTADFKPLQTWFDITDIVNAVSGNIHVSQFRYGIGGQLQDFDIAFSRADGAFTVAGGPRNMIRFQMDQDGSFYGGLSSPFPVRGTIMGTIDNKTINASCADLYVDLGELFKLVPGSREFYLTGGYINASLDIKGSLTDPEFFGSARATSLRARIPGYIREEVRPIPFNIAIDGNEASFGPIAIAAGNGAGTVSGLFFFDRWIPNTFSIDINVPRETPVPFAFDVSGFVARGDGTGKLNISMENVTFNISGELYVNNTELGINHDEMVGAGGGLYARAKIPFTVDLTVSTGPVVEFIYPSTRFPILRANPDMGTRLRVTADSLAQQYSLVSDVRIRSGEIFYFERSFYIRSGILMFRENELNFAPRLTARAEVRDRTEDGPVTISMIVDNAPLLSFTARFESTPVLSQMEILALLGQNISGPQFGGESTDVAWRAAANSFADLTAQFFMVRRLEQMVRRFTRLDMFSVRTQVLQNLVFTGAERLMSTPVDRTTSVGNYLDNTTVFGGKYIGQFMFVQGMMTIRYEGERGLTYAPDFGVELENPLFSIRWDFFPEHPENWYVNDNSITLSKSFTF